MEQKTEVTLLGGDNQPVDQLADAERIVLSDKAFDRLNEIIDTDSGKPNQKLVELMSRKKPW